MKEKTSTRRLLLDLNILLDVVLDREEAAAGVRLWVLLETGHGRGFIPAHGVKTIYYLVARAKSSEFARQAIGALMSVFRVAPIDENVLRRALALNWPDFEDSVCAAAAEACDCHAIVTRDPRGFAGSRVRVIDAATAAALLGGQ